MGKKSSKPRTLSIGEIRLYIDAMDSLTPTREDVMNARRCDTGVDVSGMSIHLHARDIR